MEPEIDIIGDTDIQRYLSTEGPRTSLSPGATVALISPKSEAQGCWGYADLDSRESIALDTRFHAASLAKPFTAIATLLLQREGLLDLDQPLAAFLPDLPVSREPVKLRHLLTHTSEIRDNWPMLSMLGIPLDSPVETDQVMEILARQQSLQHRPGECFMYSNSGFIFLAKIIENLTGRGFSDFVFEEIFEPLGMNSTLVATDQNQKISRRASAYRREGEEFIDFTPRLYVAGATSLWTTSEDMLSWLQAGPNREPFQSILKEMAVPHQLNSGEHIGYGLGCFLGTAEEKKVIFHPGVDLGFCAIFALQPERETGAALLGNFTYGDLRPACWHLLSLASGNPEKAARKNVPASDAPATRLLEQYEGHYISDRGEFRRVFVERGQLGLASSFRQSLLAEDEDCFSTPGGEGVSFLRTPEGEISEMTVAMGTGVSTWRRLDPDSGRVQRNLSGSYLLEDLDSVVEVKQTDPQSILLSFPGQDPVVFDFVGEGHFFADEGGLSIRASDDPEEGLVLSQPRCLGIKLKRQTSP